MPSETRTTIRDATPEDAAAIAEIYNQSIATGDATMDEALWSAGSVRRKLAAFGRRETILVLESGQTIAGWGIIKKYSDRRGYRFCCETAVYLRRDLVSRGFGTRIKRALIERCRRYGYHHLVAKIFADNRASIEYNKKLGYEVVGRRPPLRARRRQHPDHQRRRLFRLARERDQPPTWQTHRVPCRPTTAPWLGSDCG